MTDRPAALRVLAALQRTPIGEGAVLVGSSGLFGFDTRDPAFADAGAEGYAPLLAEAEAGLTQLLALLEGLHV